MFVVNDIENEFDDMLNEIDDDFLYDADNMFGYGNGLNAFRYSEFLTDAKKIENGYFINYHSDGSDEGIVAYDVDTDCKIRCEVHFYHYPRNKNMATILFDVYIPRNALREKLIRLLKKKKCISVYVPGIGDVDIDIDIEPIADRDYEWVDENYSKGFRISHSLNIGRCGNGFDDGISNPRIEQIYNISSEIQKYIIRRV